MKEKRWRALAIGLTIMNMSIKKIMIGKMKAVHWLIRVVERINKRGN